MTRKWVHRAAFILATTSGGVGAGCFEEKPAPISGTPPSATQQHLVVAEDPGDHAFPGEPNSEETKLIAALPKDLQELLAATDAFGDDADKTLDDALARAEQNARENGITLRDLFAASPAAAHGLRRKVVYALGRLGGADDVSLLANVALNTPPRGPRADKANDGHEGNDGDDSEEAAVVQRMALYSLSRLTDKKVPGAEAGLRALLERGDRETAISTALELFEKGRLDERAQAVLKERGLPTAFRRLNPEKVYTLPAAELPRIKPPREGKPVSPPPRGL